MEINKVGDLIPYRLSLKELWVKEEFQPVLGLLNSLKEEAILEFRMLELSENAEEVKTHVAILKTQLNIAGMFLQLPTVIKEAEEQIAQKEKHSMRLRQSQEGSNL